MRISLLILLLSSMVYAKDIIVMEIDTGIDLSHPEIESHIINQNDIDSNDSNGHGTHVAGIILQDTCPQVKLVSCKYFFQIWEAKIKSSLDCFQDAVNLKVDYVNYSSGGMGKDKEEERLIRLLSKNGTVIVVAAGNEGQNNPEYYPAKYEIRNLITVGNLEPYGERHYMSNYGFKNMVWEIGTDVFSTLPKGRFGAKTGTSQAAAVRMNRLLRARCSKLK